MLFLVIVFLIAGLILYKNILEDNRIEKKISEEYKLLKTQNILNSTVLSTYYPARWRGWQDIQNIKFENGENYTIRIKTNLTSEEIYFGEIVRKGIVLKKRANSDTLIVDLGDSEFKYLIFGDE